MNELTLSEIWVYPVKSLGGMRLDSAKVSPKGLQYDRRWMLIDQDNLFMTQRVHARMALFTTKIDSGSLIISHRGSDQINALQIPLDQPPSGPLIRSKVWDDEVDVIEVSSEASNWFRKKLGMDCKLVIFPETHSRSVDPNYSVSKSDQVSLADAYPFLIIGQSSLDDLNSRLTSPVPMNRFRPNFVFTGGTPYEEDTWQRFSIGSTNFAGVKPCSRCVLTTVDQETGVKGNEPLNTLAKFRKRENKVLFGQNVIALTYKEVHVGDRLSIHAASVE